jgi:ABC-type transport system involved in cytochrome c biogenesis ATPase subunit
VTATTTAPALEVAGLRKAFGDTVALDGIDLSVATGSIFALLGPNGAGKTTTVHILSTLIDPDSGTVRVAGFDAAREPNAVRGVIGVTGQFSGVDTLLTGKENLALMATLCHLERAEGERRIAHLLDRFDLVEASRKPAATYSGGMRRRLDRQQRVAERRLVRVDRPRRLPLGDEALRARPRTVLRSGQARARRHGLVDTRRVAGERADPRVHLVLPPSDRRTLPRSALPGERGLAGQCALGVVRRRRDLPSSPYAAGEDLRHVMDHAARWTATQETRGATR